MRSKHGPSPARSFLNWLGSQEGQGLEHQLRKISLALVVVRQPANGNA
jgi:hypothetical protein